MFVFSLYVTQRWTIVLANLAKTTERVIMAEITIPVTAVDISKDETVKVVFICHVYCLFHLKC